MFQASLIGISSKYQGWLKKNVNSVSRIEEGFKGALRVFQEYLKNIQRVFQESLRGISSYFEEI